MIVISKRLSFAIAMETSAGTRSRICQGLVYSGALARVNTRDAEPEPEPEPEQTHFGRSRSRSRRNRLLGAGAGAVKKPGGPGSEKGYNCGKKTTEY